MDLVAQEQQRLVQIYKTIDKVAADRAQTLSLHDGRTRELEQERLHSVNWAEKNDLAEKLVEHGHYDPRKYLHQFANLDSPYFGIIGIEDCDQRIGHKAYLIGKQTLMDGNRVVIVDWRKAELSRLFYDYEQGEEYLETIQGREREGVLVRKDKIGIAKGVLHRIETPNHTYQLADGVWQCDGALFTTSAETKSLAGDHRLVDIVSLIDPEQFRMITKESSGCTYITGGAGCGKTTVALHRLSYLQFNQPEQFRPERCLVLMFNRVLRNYVLKSSQELLGSTRVDTFSAWSLAALGQLGVYSLTTTFEDRYSSQKKQSFLPGLLASYVKETSRIDPVMDLWRFFTTTSFLEAAFGQRQQGERFASEMQQKLAEKTRVVSFADLSLLVRLCQLRKGPDAVISGALNWYDHVIVDEAQDLSVLELEAVLAATSSRRSLTVCADEKQKILSFVDGSGFGLFRQRLQLSGLDKESLAVSYRSAKEILALAARVSGRPVDDSKAHNGVVKFYQEDDADRAARRVRMIAEQIVAKEPKALTAVICKKKSDLKVVHRALSGLFGLHPEGEVSFDPGVLVVNVHQVKGVEFTNVILWNPSESDYRQSEIDENLLYVAITRAAKRLYAVHWRPLAHALR